MAFDEASKVASYITPVPGGVGPMTVSMLMKNTVLSAERAAESLLNNSWNLSILPLNLLNPVPRYELIYFLFVDLNTRALRRHGTLWTNLIANNIIYFSDIAIARAQTPKDISILAEEIGLLPSEISPYGNKKAKVSLNVLKRLSHQKNGKYVVVTG